MFNDEPWEPRNYENEYDGPVTLRRALAHSRNVATIKVAETTGYGEVAALWRQVGAGASPRAYAAIALGVFEATPFEIATAYTLVPERRHDPAAARHLTAGERRPGRADSIGRDQDRRAA